MVIVPEEFPDLRLEEQTDVLQAKLIDFHCFMQAIPGCSTNEM